MEQNKSKQHLPALMVIGCLFFVFGFITWSNSQLIPYLKIACQLGDATAYLVTTATFAPYFIMAFPASFILKKTGFKKGMSLGLMVMSIGALFFVQAAQVRSYNLFLSALFVISSGMTLLQTAVNPYVTILGPIESAAQRISIMGICNKVAGISSVIVLGSITLSNADEIKTKLLTLSPTEKVIELNALAGRVIVPYMVIAASLAALALIIFFIHLPEINEEEQQATDLEQTTVKTSIFHFPHLILGAIAIFFYVGVEVISYDTFTGFGESLGFRLEVAKGFAKYTGYGMLAGYLLGNFMIPKYITQQKALAVFTISSILLVLISIFTKGSTAVVCFAFLGFTNSVVWPAIWPLAIYKLGKFTKTGAALLIMGIVGGAILPPCYGKISELIGSRQMAYALMIPCYLFILYFAWAGHKVGLKANKTA